MQGSRLLESDMLGDTSLTPSQARYLLHLLCPYSTTALPSDCGKLAKTDPHPSLEHILKVHFMSMPEVRIFNEIFYRKMILTVSLLTLTP